MTLKIDCPCCDGRVSHDDDAPSFVCPECSADILLRAGPTPRVNWTKCPACQKSALRYRVKTLDYRCKSCQSTFDNAALAKSFERKRSPNTEARLERLEKCGPRALFEKLTTDEIWNLAVWRDEKKKELSSAEPVSLANLRSAMGAAYQLDVDSVLVPQFVKRGSDDVHLTELEPDDRAEAVREYQLRTIAVNLAVQEYLTRFLEHGLCFHWGLGAILAVVILAPPPLSLSSLNAQQSEASVQLIAAVAKYSAHRRKLAREAGRNPMPLMAVSQAASSELAQIQQLLVDFDFDRAMRDAKARLCAWTSFSRESEISAAWAHYAETTPVWNDDDSHARVLLSLQQSESANSNAIESTKESKGFLASIASIFKSSS